MPNSPKQLSFETPQNPEVLLLEALNFKKVCDLNFCFASISPEKQENLLGPEDLLNAMGLLLPGKDLIIWQSDQMEE